MTVERVTDRVHSVGARDWDRRLFDELIPLPEGTTYNAYLVRGSEKTALIDAVDPTKAATLLGNLESLDIERIDYVIVNHAEQDHSGALPEVLARWPMARVVTNAKCREMLKDLLPIAEDRLLTIEDGGTLSLGDRTLEFILAPWVHWPETMFTWLREEEILFSCDFLGSHYATSDLFSTDGPEILAAAKRYYAEIMMPFRAMIRKHLERLAPYPIKLICPSHGPIYRRPDFILDAYREWVSDAVKNKVIVGFVSMHGSTRLMAERFIDELIKRGIKVKPCNLVTADLGHLAMDLVDAATMVVATPVVLTGVHPLAITPIYLTNLLRPKLRHLGLISSYGWGGKVVEKVRDMITTIQPEIFAPVLVKGLPRAADFAALATLAETIAERHRRL